MRKSPGLRCGFFRRRNSQIGLLKILTISLSLTFLTTCARLNQKVTDSFCEVYQPLIQAKGDSNIKAPKAVLDRMATNEQTYQTFCVKHGETR